MAAGIGQIFEMCYTAACVALAVYVLSVLDRHPMPHLADYGLGDVKFWCPPHAAIAVILFNTDRYPALLSSVKSILACTVAGVATFELGEPFVKDQVILRSLVVGVAMLAGKLAGAVFAPAVAIAVLFHDNAAMRGNLGRWYCLTPGLNGTLVLMLLAAVKIEFTARFLKVVSWMGGDSKKHKKS